MSTGSPYGKKLTIDTTNIQMNEEYEEGGGGGAIEMNDNHLRMPGSPSSAFCIDKQLLLGVMMGRRHPYL